MSAATADTLTSELVAKIGRLDALLAQIAGLIRR